MTSNMTYQTSFILKAGDTVAIVAPSGILKSREARDYNRLMDLLKSWGLHARVGKHVFNQCIIILQVPMKNDVKTFKMLLDDPNNQCYLVC
jgi:muramoyltetrapeptide carboxypeptidase LdcA involved in peptidoglycan recycling